jgi:hypothetical protein
VAQKKDPSGSRRNEARAPVALELSPERAFVLHLDACAGRIARITSLGGLVAFLVEVLRDGSAAFDRRSER